MNHMNQGNGLSNRARLIIGFGVAGVALVALADVAPQTALGLVGVLALGVVLSHADQVQQLVGAFNTATGH